MKIKHIFDRSSMKKFVFVLQYSSQAFEWKYCEFVLVSLLFFPTYFTKLAVCLNMQTKQHWGGQISFLYCWWSRTARTVSSAQHTNNCYQR